MSEILHLGKKRKESFKVYTVHMHPCVRAQLRLTLFDPMHCTPPGSSVHGLLQARIPPCPPPGDLPNPGVKLGSLTSLALTVRFFTTGATTLYLLLKPNPASDPPR